MNDIVQWDPNSGSALPAYLQEGIAELGSNIPDRMTVPSLSYEGKMWTIVKDGNKEKLQVKNQDGDMVPVSIMRAIILNANPDRGRAYYPGAYNPSEAKQPDCWSPDGKTSDPGSKNRVSVSCNGCPMSVKGSKVADGREGVACSSHRMVALAPAFDIESDPLRLKLAVTSDWDKEVVEHGWFAFRQYTDFLKSKGITHTALVVTKMKFDSNTPHPKVLFSLDRAVTQEEYVQVKRALANPKVAELLAEKWSAAGVNGTQLGDPDTRPHGLEGAVADGWIAHPDAAGYFYKGQEVVDSATLAGRYPAPVAAPPALPTPEPTPPPVPATQQVIDADLGLTAAQSPMVAAKEAGWLAHPDAPGYWYLGQEVITAEELEQRYRTPEPAVAPAAPPAPPVASEPPAGTPLTPRELAINEGGWRDHPDAPGYMYLGQEVLLEADVLAKFAGNAAPALAPAAAPTSVAPAAVTDPASASPSSPAPSGDAAIPADVAELLGKWAQ